MEGSTTRMLGADFGRALLRHAGAVFTAGAVLLYAVGVVSTVGQIRATELDVTRVMALIPLETHLRNGVGIVASPMFFFMCGAYVLIYLGAKSAQRQAAVGGERQGSLMRFWDRRVYPVLVAITGLWIILALPWPFIVLVVIVVASWLGPVYLRWWLGPSWRDRGAELYVVSSIAALILISFLDAYFRSDPFPRATAITEQRRITGPLITSSDGLVYLAPSRASELYAGVATDQIVSLRTRPEKHAEEPSILNLLGVDWR